MTRVRHLLHGVAICFSGFRMWSARPGVMLLGAIPPLVVGICLVAAVVAFAFAAPGIAAWLTPFADGWAEPWPGIVRTAAGIALVAGFCVLGVLMFASLTLLIGQPFYERIWRATEQRLGGVPGEVELPLGRAIRRALGDAVKLGGIALLAAVIVFVLGLIPVVGGVLGVVAGAMLGGRALATELTGAPADARGLSLAERRALLQTRADVALGFGIAVYLLFLVPGGAVLGTPAATVGGTLLLRELRGEPTALPS